MATPNIVPRADSEGGLGTASKYWASAYIDLVDAGNINCSTSTTFVIQHTVSNQDIRFKGNDGGSTITALLLDMSAAGHATFSGDITVGDDLFLGDGAVVNFDNGNVTLTHSSGVLRLADSDSLGFGTGADLKIDHDGSHSYIYNSTGNLEITNYADDSNIIFKSDDGSGGTTAYLTLEGSDPSISLYKKTLLGDNVPLYIGSNIDLRLHHDGSNSYIQQTGTGNLYIQQNVDDGDIIFQSDDGSGGVETYFFLDGSAGLGGVSANPVTIWPDNSGIAIGTGQDLLLYHDSSNTYVMNQGVGDLNIIQHVDDKDIIFQSDNGAGGVATYFYLDGSSATHDGSATTALYTNWPDKSLISMGTGHDLQFKHDGTNSHLYNSTGDLYITNAGDNKDIILQSDDGSGGVTTYFQVDGSAEKILMKKSTVFTGGGMDFGVDDTGADVIFYGATSGRNMKWDESEDHLLFTDNTKLKIGAGGDLQFYHDGSDSYVRAYNNDLIIMQDAADKDIIFKADDGSGGTATYLTLDGSVGYTTAHKDIRFLDNVMVELGTDRELTIYSDGSNGLIANQIGNLVITNAHNDGDLMLQCDDGSGGVTPYITLDGGDVSTIVSTIKVLMPNLPTSDPSVAGQLWNSSGDLKISAG